LRERHAVRHPSPDVELIDPGKDRRETLGAQRRTVPQSRARILHGRRDHQEEIAMVWSKLRDELDRAGRAAQGAIDEGKVRLDAMRARQLADKAAQALGYALYRARKQGQDIDADTYARLSSTLAGHEAEISQIDAKLEELRAQRSRQKDTAATESEPPAAESPASESPARESAPGTTTPPVDGPAI
jgi:hypothetical protein